ncbi:nitrogen regulation protein NR(II) [Alteromonas ponticola]|uniref:Sensory histidine kinase/phosphatase NtrB n=1 Tax=Alteromonas aquimaris TaxID=2998417 RepID=A0ABT3P3Y3_9ALTE|nr:nitrogen regulation protein NR(II) [Alteromonas aquimaris]MCW8107484.1 nitrogen regulation protein NR(II) [Alteromonas aquimaris]
MQTPHFNHESLLNFMNTALVMVNRHLCIVFVNQAGEALFETGSKHLVGHPLADFFMPDSIDVNRLKAAMRRGEDFTENELELRFRDDRGVMADLTVTNVQFNEQSHLLFELRRIDRQSRISRENMQNAQHFAARELIRGLAHEIKNPLGGIRGAAQLLEKELNDNELCEFTQMIVEQSDRLRNLVDRLLGPNALPRLTWCNLHQALEKVRSLMKMDAEHAITIVRDYDPSIPDVRVDQEMIQQAVLNILKNSIQALSEAHTAAPQIKLITRIGRQLTIQGKRHPLVAKIHIIDNGPGIPNAIRDTLFYPMVSSKQSGSGLGLSIAQTLINHHGGRIDVESRVGHTAFTLYLPIDRKELTHE